MKSAKGVQLKKGEIRLMASTKCDGKPHLVQVYDLKGSESGGKPRTSMKISDGVHFIRGVVGLIHDIKDFDIVYIHTYKITEVKGNSIMIVDKMERAFTGLGGLIGTPVDYKQENPNQGSIQTFLPSIAKPAMPGGAPANEEQPRPAAPVSHPSPAPAKAEQPAIQKAPSTEVKGIKPIKALGLYSSDWTIKIRLIRKGDKKKFNRQDKGESVLVPLEFIDAEGTQIAATLFGPGVEKYDDKLVQGNCYFVTGGNIRLANKKFTSIRNDYCINLDAVANIEETADDPLIPKTGFTFTPIGKISELPTNSMIDVLGIVKTVGEITPFVKKDGTQTIKRTISLYDESGHAIELTFWGPLAEGEYKEEDLLGFRCVRVSEFAGKQLNSVAETMILKDPDDPRTEKLREFQMANIGGDLVSLTTRGGGNDNFAMIAELNKTAETLSTDNKGIYAAIPCSVISVIYEKGYTYNGCKKCKKKILEKACDRCKEENAATPYYLFNIRISDGSDSCWVSCFGDLGQQLLGKPATEVVALQEQDPIEFKKVFESVKTKVFFS